MKTFIAATAAIAVAGVMALDARVVVAADGPTLTAVKARGAVISGVHSGRYGFAIADSKGK